MSEVVSIVYTNYRGEMGERKIVPKKIWFGATEYHPEPQWLLEALDVARNEDRNFAMKDIKSCTV